MSSGLFFFNYAIKSGSNLIFAWSVKEILGRDHLSKSHCFGAI